MSALEGLLEQLRKISPEGQKQLAGEMDGLLQRQGARQVWYPNVGPQTDAYFCLADELFYGGEAGGGKSDLLAGTALTQHYNAVLLRRTHDDVKDLVQRTRAIAGDGHGYNGQDKILTVGERVIRFAGCQYEQDKERHKGKPRDFYGFDEIGDFTFSQYKFITTWNRSTRPGQRCRVVAAGNPPTRPEGLWVVQYWAAWLDPLHPKPAKAGELRWYIRGPNDEDIEVDGRGPHTVEWSQRPLYAKSRTFIPSSLDDNPDLASTDYAAMLDSLPAELRRAYRDGDFTTGLKDDDYQVIPTAWIDDAQQRWRSKPPEDVPMTCMAIDVAPGGGDQRVIGWRYDAWVAPLDAKREVDKTGGLTAAAVVRHRRDGAPVVVDVGGGWGGDCLIALKDNRIDCMAFLGVAVSNARTRDGKLKFRNKRAEVTWRTREALDPSQKGGSDVALPPDPELKADLAAYRYDNTINGILIEDKEEMKKRIGRSPDKGDTVCMLIGEGQKAADRADRSGYGRSLPTHANVGHATAKRKYA